MLRLASQLTGTQVLETIINQRGLKPQAVKSNLNTKAGIDSKHITNLRSTVGDHMN